MQINKNFLIIILSFFLISSLLVFLVYSSISKKQDEILEKIYQTTYKNINEKVSNLISDKSNTSLAIAIALSKDENLYSHFRNEDYEKLNYKGIAKLIEDNSKYKNIWIQVLDKNRNSIYRSWTNIRGGLQFRDDLQNQNVLRNISTSISIGLFNIGIKARTPILDENNELFGALEIVTHFDSISEDLEKDSLEPIVIAEKRFRKNIKYPMLSSTFIDDYHIANGNASKKLCNYLEKNGIEKYVNIDTYLVENGYFIANYHLLNDKGDKIGSILNFYDLKNLDLEYVNSLKKQNILTALIVLMLLLFATIIYMYSKYVKNIKASEQKNRLILDTQSSIVIITNGKEILDANKKLFDFFVDYDNLIDFKKEVHCICKKFVDIKNEDYLLDLDYDAKNWAQHALFNQDKDFKVAMYDSNENLKHFSLKVSKLEDNDLLIATFTDISKDILKSEREKNEQKFIYQQAKINAISNTLENIAHQWRQPLSVISTLASGLKLKKELNILQDKELVKSCDTIVFNTSKLSNTIENFSNFFMNSSTENRTSLVENIHQVIDFLDSILERNGIVCLFEYDRDILLNCESNTFSEVFLNILDNSIAALIENTIESDRYILIKIENSVLTIKDSGGGIDEKIVSKIFEPYFTTKHQSYGVGLGLYIVEEFFTKTLNKKIELKNEEFVHENKNLKGLNFIIYLH